MKYKAVVFDLDGTLLNTLEDLADGVNAVLTKRGYPCRTTEEIRTFVGNGIGELVRLALPVGTEEATFTECLREFKTHYAAHMEDKTAPYAGILPLLDRLRADGYMLGVVSNKFDEGVKQLCARYFADRIDMPVGESEQVRRKPYPDSVYRVMEALEVTAEECVYVGDSDVDMQTAENAGLESIGVTWGFRSAEVLRKAGASCLADTPEELYLRIANGVK